MTNKASKRLLLIVLMCCFAGCAGNEAEPTPEAARRFLKLRGYEFDERSFFKAAEASDAIAVNGFLSAGINVNAKDENGDTALTAAAARGDSQIIGVLLKRGADVNARGRNNWTALLLALEGERLEAADILLAQPNVDLKAETPQGMTALMLAVWHQRADVVRTLLQRGADFNHQDKEGDTPLHGAAWLGNLQILQMLLDAGANPNVKNKLGGTALMWAASYGQEQAVQLLLNKGADARLKDADGITAAGWAARNSRSNLVVILREAEKQNASGKRP
jgi:ankyrin repeat protein